MRAVGVKTPGDVSQLQIQEVPEPQLRPGCLRIAVKAAGLNRADLLQRRGLYPPPAGESEILGLECSGEVLEVSSGVASSVGRSYQKGDRVMALLAGGGYAEQVVVPASHVMPMAGHLSFTQAAAIPEAFLTAQEALFSLGKLASKQSVLIHAAAGGVGSAAVQLASAQGSHIFATAGSRKKLQLASQLGAHRVINYRTENFAEVIQEQTQGSGVSVILDFVGATHFKSHRKALGYGGRWVVIGVLGGSRVELNFAQLLSQRWQILGLVMRSRRDAEKAALIEHFRTTWLPLFESKRLKPVLDREYRFEDVALAHQRMEDNANLGKIVLTL